MHVLMIGPGLTVKGGISTVERLIVDNWHSSSISLTHLSSYEDGSIAVKCAAYVKCLVYLFGSSVRERDFIAHVHFSHRGSTLRKMIILLVLRLRSVSTVMHSHGSDFDEFYRSLPRLLQWCVRSCLLKSSCVIALSQSWKRFFLDEMGLPERLVRVVRNPVETFGSSARQADSSVRILFLGRLERRKGIYDLLVAVQMLVERVESARFEVLVAGDGDIVGVDRFVRDAGIENFVKVLGWLSRQGVKEAIQSCDVFVLPSYSEGLPMSLLESMGSGLAILTTPVGGIPEIVVDGENGLLVRPGDPAMLSDALERLLDSRLRTRLGSEARRTVRGFGVEEYCREMEEIYLAKGGRESTCGR